MDWFLLALFGLAFLLVTVFLVIWRAVSCAAGWEVWICYRVARLHSLIMARWSTTNVCTYPEVGPAIIVANHSSPADPPLLWIRHFAQFQTPRLRVIGFLMAREYYLLPGIVGWVNKTMQSIPVDRSGHDMVPLREALRRLQAGHLLGIFPEGRLNRTSPDQQLLPGGTGAAWLALRSKAPVIPVFIRNAPRSESLVRAFFTPTRTALIYGKPLDLSPWSECRRDHDVLVEVTDFIMQQIAELGGILHSSTAE